MSRAASTKSKREFSHLLEKAINPNKKDYSFRGVEASKEKNNEAFNRKMSAKINPELKEYVLGFREKVVNVLLLQIRLKGSF